MTPMEKSTGERMLAVGRGKSTNLGMVSLEYLDWDALVSMSSVPAEAPIDHADFMALPKVERNKLKKAAFVSFGVFEDGHRNKDSVSSRSAAQLDYDLQTADLFRRLEEEEFTGGVVPFAYVGHTTRSHTDEAPRLRLMVPFSRDVTPEEYPRCVRAIHKLLDAPELDRGSLEPSRLMYMPVVNRNAPFWCWRSKGTGYVDPDYLLSLEAPEETEEPASDLDVALAETPLTFHQKVNALAMKAFAAWVPDLFPEAQPYKDGYRVPSASLGRELEEDISLVSKGIKDFGIADMGDARNGKRSPIALVAEWKETPTTDAAANWLCKQLGVDPAAMGGKNPAPLPAIGEFLPASAFASNQKVEWHIKHVLPKRGLIVVYGEPGSSKSFFALDMVAHVARGLEWRGHRVKQASVAYIAAEGVAGFGNRLAAYAKHNALPLDDLPLFVRGGAFDLKEQFLEISDKINEIGNVGVVVIDTLAAVTAGGNENTSEDMGAAIDAAQRIIEATGASVILIHHSNNQGGVRGWSGLRGAVDNQIRIERKDTLRTAHIEKQKEGEDGKAYGYRLKVIELYKDEDGDAVTSCAVVEDDDVAPNTRGTKKEKKSTGGDFETSDKYAKARKYLEIIIDAAGLGDANIDEIDVISAIQADEVVNPLKEADYPRPDNIKRTLLTLADRGKIRKEGRWIRVC